MKTLGTITILVRKDDRVGWPRRLPLASPLLQASDLGFRYGATPVLEAINLSLVPGTCTVIRGDNGSGKSTFLQLLQGRLIPTRGWVRVLGRPLAGQRRRLALVPQQPRLNWRYPIDLAAFVALGACGDRRARGPACGAVAGALQAVSLAPLAHQPIANLSGGQRQRALIARALVQQAAVLLLDEPLAPLDAASRQGLGRVLAELTAAGTAVVLTAHGELPVPWPAGPCLLLQQGGLQPLSGPTPGPSLALPFLGPPV